MTRSPGPLSSSFSGVVPSQLLHDLQAIAVLVREAIAGRLGKPIHVLWPGWSSGVEHRRPQLRPVSAEPRHLLLRHGLDDVMDMNRLATRM